MRKLIFTLLIGGMMANAQLATKKALTLDAAKKIAEAAHAEAVAKSYPSVGLRNSPWPEFFAALYCCWPATSFHQSLLRLTWSC